MFMVDGAKVALSLAKDLVGKDGAINQAMEISKNNNPNLIIAKLEFEQSKKDIVIAGSDLSPQATIS